MVGVILYGGWGRFGGGICVDCFPIPDQFLTSFLPVADQFLTSFLPVADQFLTSF